MKNLSYLSAPVLILALFVLGCSNDAPTVSNESDAVSRFEAPAISNLVETVPQISYQLAGNPIGNCCPEGFDKRLTEVLVGTPPDLNGDGRVCLKVINGSTITIDNNSPGDC